MNPPPACRSDKNSDLSLRLPIISRCLAALALLLATTLHAAPGGFATSGTLAASRQQHTATQLQNGKLLLVGGSNGTNPIATAELYDPNTGVWTATTALSTARQGHTATLLTNGKVLVVGGLGASSTYLTSCALFDPANNTWTATTGSLNTARAYFTANLLSDGRVLVAGGQTTGGTFVASSEVFDPATGLWTTTTGSLASARAFATSVVLPDGKVLIAGGQTTGGTALNTAELFDAATGQWSATTGNLATARYNHTTTLLGTGFVLVAGGQSGASTYLNTAELFDLSTGTWAATTGNLTAAQASASATLLPNGKVLIAGGQTTGGTTVTTAQLFNPATGTWAATGSLTGARRNHTATLLANGKVIIAGGVNASTLNTSEFYDPSTGGTWSNAQLLNLARDYHTGTLLPNGKVLVAGGGYGATNTSELFDFTTATWRASNRLVVGRSFHSSTLLTSGKVLIAGGEDYTIGSHHPLASSEIYDTTSDTWVMTSGGLAAARESHTATLLPNGKVLVTGGIQYSTYLSSCELFDPTTGRWTTTGSLAYARSFHTATLLPNGKVLVAGGENGTGTLNRSELYDPLTGQWSGTTESMNSYRTSHTATLLPSGKVLVAGGHSGSAYLASSELYDPTSGTWTYTAGSLATSRRYHTATLLPGGQVLVVGGNTNYYAVYLPTTEIYDPVTDAWTASGSLTGARGNHTATLLPNGKVLVAGGYIYGNPSELATAEVFDPGFDYPVGSQPVLSSVTNPAAPGVELSFSGTRFRGLTEGSSGNNSTSSSGYPVVKLLSLVNEQTLFLPPNASTPWSSTTYASVSVSGFPYGYALATVYANGTRSSSLITQVTAPVPVVTLSTSTLLATATTITINGTNFDPTPTNNSVVFNNGALGTVTAATATQLTITFSTKPTSAGPLTAIVSTNAYGTSGIATQVATVTPVVTSSTAVQLTTANTITINGFGFDPTAGNNSVVFNGGATGTVTASSATALTVTFGTKPSTNGSLTAVVTTNGVSSGSAVQVATSAIPVLITNTSVSNWTLNKTGYSQQVLATGGTGTLSFAVTTGALPTGLTLSSTGVISGTPTVAGTFTFTVTATDTINVTDDQGYTIVVNPVLAISTATLANHTVNKSGYSQTITRTGGTGTSTCAITAGTIPAGLTLSSAGVLSGTPAAAGSFDFTVTATDTVGAVASQSYTVVINAAVAVSPSSLLNWTLNKSGYNQTITSSNGTGTRTLSLSAGSIPTGLTFTAGTGLLSGTPNTAGTYNFTVTATDGVGATGSQSYSVVINPLVSMTTTTLPNWTVNASGYSQGIAATGGTGTLTMAVSTGTLPTGLTLSSAGLLSGTPTVAGTSNFTITTTDSVGATDSKSYTVVINAAVSITTPSLPDWTANKSVYNQTLASSGGTGTKTYSVTAGALPTGLTLSSAGALTGTPTEASTFNFTITATDSIGAVGSKVFNVVINPAIAVTPTTLANWTANKSGYSQTVSATGGTGSRTLSLSTGTIPTGLTFSTSSGLLSGTPSTAGTFNFTVTSTDSIGATGSQAYSVVINPAISLTTTSAPNWTVNTAGYSLALQSTGGTGALTFDISTGALPSGMSMSGTGDISGTPTVAGSFTFTARATDTVGAIGSRSYSITISPAMSISPTTLPEWTVNLSGYSATISKTGGTGTATFQVTAGALPTGLDLSTSGLLTGTPLTAGTFNFTVTATDSVGGTASKVYAMTINDPVSITTTTLSDWTVNFAGYNQSLAAAGGTGAKTFAVSLGTLPAGLSLSTAGVLTGTPTTTGTFTFTVRATDSAGATGTQVFTIIINSSVSITTTTLPEWTINAAGYNQSITGTGGTGALSFSVSLGSLPGGLVLSSGGVLTGTPTAAGSFTFTVKAMDGVGASGTQVFTLVVHSAVTITTTSLPKGTFNLAGYSQTLAATGGTGTITFGITTGSLPNGLTLTSAGLIAGTPLAAGTFPFTITAIDSVGGTGTMAFSLLIDAIAPTVVNPVSSMITGTTAVLGGDISSTGGATISAQGVVLAPTATNNRPTIGGSGVIRVVGTPSGAGPFTVNASALKPGTAYTFAAYATNSVGTSYSTFGTFTTLSDVATLSKLVLSSGSLTPAFASGTFSYKATASVPFITNAVTVTPTSTRTTATIKVNGTDVISGTTSPALPLLVGNNTITTLVTAQDGVTTKTYTITVTRLGPPTVTTPTSIAITSGKATLGGNVTTDNGAKVIARGVVLTPTSVNANPQLDTPGAIIVTSAGTTGVFTLDASSLSPVTAYSFAAYATNSQGTGYSSVGTFTTLSSDARLANLALSAGTLSPVFSSDALSYTANVSNATNSLTVTPTVNHAAATVTVNGVAVVSGAASVSIALNVGNNMITVVVKAEDTLITKTYTVIVKRADLPQIVVEQPADTPLVNGSASVDLGNVGLTSGVVTKMFKVRNTGSVDITSLTLTKDGTSQAMFSITAPPVAPLAPGGSTTFTVQFTPTKLGAQSAKLHLVSNDRANSPFDITLTGTGIPAVLPVVTTLTASSIGYTLATLNGTVNAKGSTRTVFFDYGATTAYGNTVAADQATVSGSTATNVTLTLTGLQPHTTYHYRVRASSADGSASGTDKTFITSNHLPVGVVDNVSVLPSAPVVIAVLGNDTDADGDALSIASFTAPAASVGKVTKAGNTLVFTPTATFTGGSFTYIVSDSAGGKSPATAVNLNTGSCACAASITVPSDQGVFAFPVTASAPFTVTNNPTWLTFTPVSPGATQVAFTFAPNSSTTSRTATIVVGGINVFVTQQGIAGAPVLSVPTAIPNAALSANYDLAIPTQNGPVTYTATGLPKGLTLSNTTGRITGMPTVAGTSRVRISAKNAINTSNTISFDITVLDFPTALVGGYTAVIARDATVNNGLGGLVTFNVSAGGPVTGTLKNGGTSYNFTGRLNTAVNAANPVPLNARLTVAIPKTSLVLVVNLNNPSTEHVSGSLSLGSATAAIDGTQNVWSTTGHAAATSYASLYTIALQPTVSDATLPMGDGFITFSVSSTGVISWSGQLADGTALPTGSSNLGPLGEVPLFAALNTNTGSLLGLPAINSTTRAVTGNLTWSQTQKATTQRAYTSGFGSFNPLALAVLGGAYTPPVGTAVLTGMTLPTGSGQITFLDGGIGASAMTTALTQTITISATNVASTPSIFSGNTAGITVTKIDATKGTFTGTLTLKDPDPFSATQPQVTRPVSFNGVFLQGANNLGTGYFLLPEIAGPPAEVKTSPMTSGQVLITPMSPTP